MDSNVQRTSDSAPGVDDRPASGSERSRKTPPPCEAPDRPEPADILGESRSGSRRDAQCRELFDTDYQLVVLRDKAYQAVCEYASALGMAGGFSWDEKGSMTRVSFGPF